MNKQEFTRRVLRQQDTLYRVSCGFLREPQDRMDAVQEAVLKAWANIDHLREERFFETWLTRICINECRNLQRRKATLPLDAAREPAAPEKTDSAIRDAVMALDENLRVPVILHYIEGYRGREIAGMLNVPEGTIRSRLRRARALLRDMLKEDRL